MSNLKSEALFVSGECPKILVSLSQETGEISFSYEITIDELKEVVKTLIADLTSNKSRLDELLKVNASMRDFLKMKQRN